MNNYLNFSNIIFLSYIESYIILQTYHIFIIVFDFEQSVKTNDTKSSTVNK